MVNKEYLNIRDGRKQVTENVWANTGTYLTILPQSNSFYAYIIRTKGDGTRYNISLIGLNSVPESFSVHGDFAHYSYIFYEATEQEVLWLDACIEANSLVPIPEVNKLYPIF